ncbi:hypothetical protein ACWEHT_11675 [Streptomyces sp. NPDC004646]
MALTSFQLDHQGVRALFGSTEVRAMVDDAALQIQTRVRSKVPAGTPVRVDKYTTDRGAASVVVADYRAMAWQARDGILTRAAAEAGIPVRAWQR